MKINFLGLLTGKIHELPAVVDTELLYRTAVNEGYNVSFDEFQSELMYFLKNKKVKDFEILDATHIKINSFTNSGIYQMLKYFKVGVDVLQIDSRILYSCWSDSLVNKEDGYDYETFIKEFRNKMAGIGRSDYGRETYFEDGTLLVFKVYKK